MEDLDGSPSSSLDPAPAVGGSWGENQQRRALFTFSSLCPYLHTPPPKKRVRKTHVEEFMEMQMIWWCTGVQLSGVGTMNLHCEGRPEGLHVYNPGMCKVFNKFTEHTHYETAVREFHISFHTKINV